LFHFGVAWTTRVVEWTDHGDHPVAAADQEGRARVPTVIYVGTTGQEYTVDAVDGESVMATAVKNGVPGIIGECGGNASCATCHVWVRDEFVPLVGEPGETEEDLLEMGVSDRREGSRLSCQIKMSDELDGLTVDIAPQEI
jgi:2Fe-2S ferredoxin